jgi:hypothetical protein
MAPINIAIAANPIRTRSPEEPAPPPLSIAAAIKLPAKTKTTKRKIETVAHP